jgi:hypothetical protein
VECAPSQPRSGDVQDFMSEQRRFAERPEGLIAWNGGDPLGLPSSER